MPSKKRLPVSLPPLKLNSKLYLPLLVVLLVVAAYLLGILTTKEIGIGHLPILGNKGAKVTIVEFSDFQCPFCSSLWKDTLPQIKKDYIDTGKVKFAYRHYPLVAIHPNAQKAAEASECANEQGKFWEYHDKLFENQSEWEGQAAADALTSFASYADTIGINGATLKSCVDSGKFADAVTKDADEGTTAGVNGTPATYVNGLLVSGAQPYSAFKTIIDQELSK